MKIEYLRNTIVFIFGACCLSGEGKNGSQFFIFHLHQPPGIEDRKL
jgi:hypothetical protein